MAKTKTRTIVRYAKPKRRKKAGFTIPLAIAAPMVYTGARFIDKVQSNGVQFASNDLMGTMTGYRPDLQDKWRIQRLAEGAMPLLVGMMIHKVAGRLGVNRALGRAGIPIIRV